MVLFRLNTKINLPKIHENCIQFLQGVGLVVCGDDKGSLWLYNMPTMVQVLHIIKLRNKQVLSLAPSLILSHTMIVVDLPGTNQEGGGSNHKADVARTAGRSP